MRGVAPLPSLNAHQHARHMAHAEVERCSCIKVKYLTMVTKIHLTIYNIKNI
jgi:hypothetical protein